VCVCLYVQRVVAGLDARGDDKGCHVCLVFVIIIHVCMERESMCVCVCVLRA
jgi:hypothetical protein